MNTLCSSQFVAKIIFCLQFKLSTDEQKMLIFEVFDRVGKLQNLVVSEVSWLYTVVFYGTCLLAAYLMTATKRTSGARLWLYLILTLNFLLERFICQYAISSQWVDYHLNSKFFMKGIINDPLGQVFSMECKITTDNRHWSGLVDQCPA